MYTAERGSMYRISDKGERELMCNFVAEVKEEIRYVDGINSESMLLIHGEQLNTENMDAEPIILPPVLIPATEFATMAWIMPNWGVRAVIRPGGGLKDDLRTAIQLRSKPKLTTIYKHLGWTEINGRSAYLHAGGAITAGGNDSRVQVVLPTELQKYNLATQYKPVEGFRASLDLLKLTKPEIVWPLLAATYLPIFGSVDFGLHLTGRTGTFKSEIMSLFQSHFGPEMDSRHLPGSWSSTANALEAQAFLAANAPFVIDDFVPTGTAWQIRSYQQTADKIIRAQGNQAGRARLTDVSSLQQTMYPRGIVLSTGEDTPEGHSVRARLLILDLAPGDIDPKRLTAAQQNRKLFSASTVGLIQWVAREPRNLTPRAEQLRMGYINIGHTRTPSMLARLVACIEQVLEYGKFIGAITDNERKRLTANATAAIEKAGMTQQSFLEDADPVDQFTAALRQVFNSGGGHVRTVNGGVPAMPLVLGWTSENSTGELPVFKSRGPIIGWVNTKEDELFLDITAGYNIVKKTAGAELSLSKQTLFRRLKDAGILTRVDDARQRNTVRITAEQHPRQVLAMSLSTVLETQETSDAETEE